MALCEVCRNETGDDEGVCANCWQEFTEICPGCNAPFYAPNGERTCPDCLGLLHCRICDEGPLGRFAGDLCDSCKDSMQSTCFHCQKEFYEPDYEAICPYCGYNCYTEVFSCRICHADLDHFYTDTLCDACKDDLDTEKLARRLEEIILRFPGSGEAIEGCSRNEDEEEEIELLIYDAAMDWPLVDEDDPAPYIFQIGELVELTVRNTAEAPMTKVCWEIEGMNISDYHVVPGENGNPAGKVASYAKILPLAGGLLERKHISFYWICAGTVTVSVEAEVNGQHLYTTASVKLLGPTDISLTSVTDQVKAAPVRQFFKPTPHLTFGGYEPERRPGIIWTCRATAPRGVRGEIACTQLMRIHRIRKTNDGNTKLSSSQGKYVLDEVHHYDINPPVGGDEEDDPIKTMPLGEEKTVTIIHEDSPAMPLSREVLRSDVLHDEISFDDAFIVYFMFRPDGDEDNIWVTLAKMEWYCKGRAVWSGDWVLHDADQSLNPSGHASFELPVWEDNRSNIM